MGHYPMLACVDVGYQERRALAACLTFAHWRAAEPLRVFRASMDEVAGYEPGAFYKRELPALMAVLAQVPQQLTAIVIDGYVWLDGAAAPGLGARLYDALGGETAIIGAAKSRYADDRHSIAVLRGESQKPLYVTAAGIEQEAAAEAIRSMHGPNRIPTLLQRADAAARL